MERGSCRDRSDLERPGPRRSAATGTAAATVVSARSIVGRSNHPPVAVTRWTYLGLVLLAVGLLTAGVGGATHVDERRCDTIQFVTIVNASAANVSTDGYDAIAFGNLSSSEQQVFRSARAANGQVLTKRGAIEDGIVVYEGDRYLVRTATEEGCSPWHPTRVLAPLGGGLGLVIVGGGLTRGLDPGA